MRAFPTILTITFCLLLVGLPLLVQALESSVSANEAGAVGHEKSYSEVMIFMLIIMASVVVYAVMKAINKESSSAEKNYKTGNKQQ
ncbi:MAG: hypothetical protein WCL14_05705 [Bacteroidota bacterium]